MYNRYSKSPITSGSPLVHVYCILKCFMYAMFALVYVCCRGRAVTNVVRTCSPIPLLKRQLNMFKLKIRTKAKVGKFN